MKICLGKRPDVHEIGAFNKLGDPRFLGRLVAPDPRDANYRYRAVRRQLTSALGATDKSRTRRAWGIDAKRLPLDQGPTPRCVGFSIATAAVVGPKVQRRTMPTRKDAEDFANMVYFGALQRDEWDGEDDLGTSVRAGMEMAVAVGLFNSYVWGENVADVFDFGLNFGPVNMGSIWPGSMMETDRYGYLNIDPASSMDGRHAAGHAWCITTFDLAAKNPDGTVGYVEIEQTWGKPWGLKGSGRARMTATTLGTLIMAGADVCFGTEVNIKPEPAIVAGADATN